MVIRDALESQGLTVTGICDDDAAVNQWMEYDITHDIDTTDELIVSIGKAEHRKAIAERLAAEGFRFGRAIHAAAVVSRFTEIGEGSVVMAGTVINSGSQIGRHCIINTGAVVEHDCRIGDYIHIAPHATLCGGLTIGEGSWIGAGAVVVQGVRIGKWCIIGAGSIVLHDIPDGMVAYGNPCKIIRKYEKIRVNQ